MNRAITRSRPVTTLSAIAISVCTGLLSGSQYAIADDDHGWGKHRSYCSKTARVARRACLSDVKDNYLTTRANCIQLPDSQSRHECREQAEDTRAEEKAECSDILDARKDVCDMLGEARYHPEIDPANFVDPAAIGDTVAPHPFFDLTPGYTRIYESGDETITVVVTDETFEIMGVQCTVIRDIVEEDGVVIEDTVDWHAQDIYGNVWYFGEISQNFEDGVLTDLDGSFMAGKDYAEAGIIMKAMPQPGDVYREEWALSEAEDLAEVISITASESAAAADCNSTCLQTRNWTPLEPGITESKFYAPGIGFIVEIKPGVDGEPDERVEIVDYYHAAP